MENLLNSTGENLANRLFSFILMNCVVFDRSGRPKERIDELCDKIATMMDDESEPRGMTVVILGTMLVAYLQDFERQHREAVSTN